MRKQIVVGNWKMNKNHKDAKESLLHLNTFIKTHTPICEIIIAPPAIYLYEAVDIMPSSVFIASQNISEYEKGAFTGEISAGMLASIDVKSAILGHSERRIYYGETDVIIAKKITQALNHNIIPIYCNGETIEQRKAEKHFDVIKNQIETALFHLTAEQIKKIIIAYEPVWAIGTGETASPEQAQEMHSYIRKILTNKYGEDIANTISILYGGSVKPSNAEEIFSKPDVDGGLIGGASLDVNEFGYIINICK